MLSADRPAPEPDGRFWRWQLLGLWPDSERPHVAHEPDQVGAGKLPLLAVDLEHGLALDGAGVRRQPLLPDGGRRGHGVGGEAVEYDVVAEPTVDRVVAR